MTSSPVEPPTAGRPVLRLSAVNLVALAMTAGADVLAVAFAGEEAFARYAQALALTSLTHLVVTQRLEVLLLNMSETGRQRLTERIVRIAIPSLLAIAVVCIVVVVIEPSSRTAVLLLVPPITAVHAVTEVLSSNRSAERRFSAVAGNRFLVGLGLLVAVPIAAAVSTTAVSLLTADLVARAIALIPLVASVPAVTSAFAGETDVIDPERADPGERGRAPERDSAEDPDIGSFRRNYLPAAAVSALSIALVPLVGPIIFDAVVVAAFLVVFRIASALAGAIGRAVALISPVLIGVDRASRALIDQYRGGVIRGVAAAGVAVVAGLALLTTPSLRAYGTAALAVAPWLLAVGVAQVSAAHFVARRWFRLSLKMTVVDVLLTIGGLALGRALDSMTLGLAVYGITAVLAAAAFAVVARQRELL